VQKNNRNRDRDDREQRTRINHMIRVPKIRVTRDDEQLGILSTSEALRLAQDAGLDLVEVAPQAKPPVCRIMDYGKFQYELKQKEKEQRRKQREGQVEIKELRLRPVTGDHDAEVKSNHARKFLEDGKKVQFNIMFKGRREMCHKDQGFAVIKKIVADLAEVSDVESPPKMEGNRITCRLTPKKK
jgi:translation initiation factor IF-3